MHGGATGAKYQGHITRRKTTNRWACRLNQEIEGSGLRSVRSIKVTTSDTPQICEYVNMGAKPD